MLDFNTNHKALVLTAFLVFVVLSFGVAIFPANEMQKYEPLPGQEDLTKQEFEGLKVYNAEGCVACHTQQVRNIEMDQTWGRDLQFLKTIILVKNVWMCGDNQLRC
jgi:cytochrome c oxidase cbb3-type subunit 2